VSDGGETGWAYVAVRELMVVAVFSASFLGTIALRVLVGAGRGIGGQMNRYPTEDQLKAIASGPAFTRAECTALMTAAIDIWEFDGVRWDGDAVGTVTLVTGGWSGNEDVVDSLRQNYVFWSRCWESSHRGGKHVFKLPEE
jgi:hypothetical protein